MKYVRVAGDRGERVFAVVFDRGDDLLAELQRFISGERIANGRLTGIGGFSSATLGYFDREGKEYEPIPIEEQVEVLSLLGTIALMDGKPFTHMHATVGHRGGSVSGGHVRAATVWPTLEMFVDEYNGELHRKLVPEVGAALIDLS
jgi:uncharacterized protein